MSVAGPPFRPPLGWLPYVAAGGAVGLVVLLGNSGTYGWAYQLWPLTSAAFHQRLDLAGPVAAFAGAYVAGRLTPADRVFSMPRFLRDPYAYAASQLAPLSATIVFGYLVGMAPAVVLTVATATAGSLDVFGALTGLVGLLAFITLGWTLGVLARTALIAPVAFALAFAATLLGYSGDDYAAVLPVMYVTPTLGFSESAPLTLFRLVFFGLVAAFGVWAGASILRRRQFIRSYPGVGSLRVLPLVVLAVLAITTGPALFSGDEVVPTNCRESAGVEYCVHQGNSRELNAMVEAVAPVMARYGVDNSPFNKVHDWALQGPTIAPDHARTYFYDLGPSISARGAAPNLAGALAGLDACHRGYSEEPDAPQMANAMALAGRLQGEEFRGDLGSFARISDTDLRVWVTEHAAAIRDCMLTQDQLP